VAPIEVLLFGVEGGEFPVREGLLVRPWLAAIAAATAGVVALLVFASGGGAASGNICVSPSATNASCVKESLAPHVISQNGDAISVTDFKNESGIGGATATHVVVSANFSAGPVTVKRIILLVNGSVVFTNSPPTPASPNPCTPATLPASASSVSCAAGNIVGGGTVRLIVRFSTGVATDVLGKAVYGESGNDNCPTGPNCTVNDTQGSVDSLTIATSGQAQGNCFDPAQFVKGLVTVSGSTLSTIVTASVGAADPSQNLPCTPASAGVDANAARPPLFKTSDVAFVEFLKLPGAGAGGVGTVTIELASVPAGFVLKEFVPGTPPDPTDPTQWVDVPPCVSGLPPAGSDSCIAKVSGKKFTLNVLGSPVDPRYGG
jgi:hypothetical protein